MEPERILEQKIGRVVSRWANLELHVAMVFSMCLNLEMPTACGLLSHCKTFSLKLDLANEAFLRRAPEKYHPFWKTLVTYIRELSGDRNFVAHTNIVHVVSKKQAMLGPTVMEAVADRSKREPIDSNEVEEIGLDIEHAIRLLGEIIGLMRGVGASSDILEKEVERRRPSRAHRRQNRRKAPTTQPPPSQV